MKKFEEFQAKKTESILKKKKVLREIEQLKSEIVELENAYFQAENQEDTKAAEEAFEKINSKKKELLKLQYKLEAIKKGEENKNDYSVLTNLAVAVKESNEDEIADLQRSYDNDIVKMLNQKRKELFELLNLIGNTRCYISELVEEINEVKEYIPEFSNNKQVMVLGYKNALKIGHPEDLFKQEDIIKALTTGTWNEYKKRSNENE